MKRCILVSSRIGKDEKTNDELLFLTLCYLPKRMNNGKLFYPKQKECLTTACINKSRRADEFERLSKLLPGTLVDVVQGVNEYSGNLFIASINVVSGTENIFDEAILYQ